LALQIDVFSEAEAQGVSTQATTNATFVPFAPNQCPQNIVLCSGVWPYGSSEISTVFSSTMEVDLTVSNLTSEQYVAINTVRIEILDSKNGLVGTVDLSSVYKIPQMALVDSPYYSDALFCRYDAYPEQVFFNSETNRWNAWCASGNLSAINSTLCAFYDIPNKDRMMFSPTNWKWLNLGGSGVEMELTMFWNVWPDGTCYTSSTTIPIIGPTASPTPLPPLVPVVPIIAIVVAIVGGIVLVCVVAASGVLGRRERDKNRERNRRRSR
jgi:hypothetical protein